MVLAAAALVLTACGGNNDTTSSSGGTTNDSADACKSATGDGPKVGLAYDVGGRGDDSFNDSAYEGMKKAIADLGRDLHRGQGRAG